jgi:pSer/pThr/pTyr-binding forkhead associated (FHA) protein
VHGDRTVIISNFDSLQDAIGPQDNASIDLNVIPPDVASLVVRSGPQAGDRFDLHGRVTRLGRHAEIECQESEYVLRDMGSMNGTYVNQRRVDSVVLAQGDEILIGRFRLIFLEPAGDL